MNKTASISIVLIIAALGLGFFGGMEYQMHKTRTFSFGSANFTGGGRFRQVFNGSGQDKQNFIPLRGQVVSTDNNTLTLKLTDGSTKLVILSGSTVFQKMSTASAADLKKGTTITVVGKQDTGGTLTAQNVSIGSMGMRKFGPTNQGK